MLDAPADCGALRLPGPEFIDVDGVVKSDSEAESNLEKDARLSDEWELVEGCRYMSGCGREVLCWLDC